MEGKTSTIVSAEGLTITMDAGDLPKQDPQTPAICPRCGSPSHNDTTRQLSTKRTLHMCAHCNECFCTVPNAKSEEGQMTGFYSVKLKAISPYEKAESHYQCLLCNKMFGTLSDRNAHMEKHAGVNTHMCTQCGFVSSEKSVIEAHMVAHKEEPAHKCPVCCQVFGTSTEVDAHLSSHLGDALHRCMHCSFVSTTTPDVQPQIMTLSLVHSEAKRQAGVITQNVNIRITYSCSSDGNQPATVSEHDDHEAESSNAPVPIKIENDSEDDYDSGQVESAAAGADDPEVHSVPSRSKQPGKNLKPMAGKKLRPGQHATPRAKHRGKYRRKDVAAEKARKPKDVAAEKAREPKSHAAEVYKCPHCSCQFGHEAWFKRHLQIHSRCVLCKSQFSTPEELNTHILTHTEGKELKCTLCDKWFSDLKTHVATSHAGSTDGQDVQAGAEAASTQEVFAADKTTTGVVSGEGSTESDRPHKCSVCGKCFSKRINLLTHQKTHIREKSFECSLCGLKCASTLSFKRHMERHTIEKQHQCSVCGKKVSTAISLKEHMATQHSAGETSYQCILCEKQFPTKAYLRKHVNSHSDDKPYQCSQCDKRYRTKTALKNHELRHAGISQCSYCGKQLCDAVTLKQHEMIHTGEIPYPCSICDKRFRTKSRLNAHVIIHTGVRPHMCSVCGKTFPSSTGLRSHIKNIHSENKRHECLDCGKKFYHVGSWKSHMNGHTGEKPYVCNENECGRSFANKGSLQRHSCSLKRPGPKKKKGDYQELPATAANHGELSSHDHRELNETAVAVSSLEQPYVPGYGGGAPEHYSIISVEVISDV